MSEKVEKIDKSKNREREAWAAARKRSHPLMVAGHAFRRAASAARKSGEPVLATADGKEAATALLKAAVQWRNDARQYATDHGKPPMDRPSVGPWRWEATEAEDYVRMRFLRAAHNYVWAKALGWDAKASGGRLLNAALRLPRPPKRKKRKPEVGAVGAPEPERFRAELAEVRGDPFECG